MSNITTSGPSCQVCNSIYDITNGIATCNQCKTHTPLTSLISKSSMLDNLGSGVLPVEMHHQLLEKMSIQLQQQERQRQAALPSMQSYFGTQSKSKRR